eukprot:scaffold31509_cov71-Phaeocystis_antarctica.AAC.5
MGATCTSVPRGKYSSSFASERKVTCSSLPSTGLAMTIASKRPWRWSPGAPPRTGRNASSSECAARMPHTQPPAMSGECSKCSWTQAPPTSRSDLVLYALTLVYSTFDFADRATCRAFCAAARLQRSCSCVRLDIDGGNVGGVGVRGSVSTLEDTSSCGVLPANCEVWGSIHGTVCGAPVRYSCL